jgi:hypothetical protein
VKQIQLTKGLVALVDDEDYERLSSFKWKAHHRYAARNVRRNGKFLTIMMHREILKAPSGMDVDHINGDRLDNRRSNLRLATRSQNTRNRKGNKNSISGYKGVGWHARCRKWQAAIKTDDKQLYLGLFDAPEDAARAYDAAARNLHGPFAKVNFPEEAKTLS